MSRTSFAFIVALVFVLLAGSAMLRTSTTFDEIVFPTVGARGIRTGDFSMVNDHPRLAQYLFGLPVYASGAKYPPEEGYKWDWFSRYHYARAFFWASGNQPERLAMSTRLVALVFGALTVLAAYGLARRHFGDAAALAAAALVAFLPDMLAHSGVAYNDVPLAFGILVSVFALDAAVREPRPMRVVAAALASALTMCVKYSGLVLLPVLAVLLACEALSGRARDPAWRRGVLLAIPVFAGVVYLAIALLYLGDWRLSDFSQGLRQIMRTSTSGRVAFLLGESNVGGWWYFFPVAFALKTPLALHAMMLAALAAAWGATRGADRRALLTHPARVPAVGAGLFLAALLASGVNIGTRHALPMIVLLLVLVALGVSWLWQRARRPGRVALAALFAGYIASSASHYPYFLSYLSEYAYGRPLHRTLVDSNTDWGQGLVALSAFMRNRGIPEVALGYFGSALPEGYGIRYVAMPSFLDLPSEARGSPRYLVVSATLLTGNYVRGDPYAALRGVTPAAIVADTLYVFDRGTPAR